MNLEAIAGHLAQNNCGTLGKNLFVSEMPTDCKNGILLIHPYYGTPINHELPGYYDTEFRLVVRSVDYNTGNALALQASGLLTSQMDLTLPGMLIKRILPVNLPRPYRRSVGGYWEFQVEVEITYVALPV